MATFRVLPQSELAEQHFDEWPVWSEHYGFDEIEDIERWGLDPEQVLRQFRENERGNEHCVYTLLESNPFPPRMRIFIRAELKTASGIDLKGNVMNEDAFCLTVYAGGEEFVFSAHPMLADLNQTQEKKLAQSLGVPPRTIFPIEYRTAYANSDGKRIEGSFRYGGHET